jgi:hypothetical protein
MGRLHGKASLGRLHGSTPTEWWRSVALRHLVAFAEHLPSTRRVWRFYTNGQRHHKKNNSKYTFCCITTNDSLIFDSEHLSKFQYRIYVCIYIIYTLYTYYIEERERCDVVIIHRLLIQAPYLRHIRRQKSHHPHVTAAIQKSHIR